MIAAAVVAVALVAVLDVLPALGDVVPAVLRSAYDAAGNPPPWWPAVFGALPPLLRPPTKGPDGDVVSSSPGPEPGPDEEPEPEDEDDCEG